MTQTKKIIPGTIMYIPASLIFEPVKDTAHKRLYKSVVKVIYPTYVLFEVSLQYGQIKRCIQKSDIHKCKLTQN